MTSQHERSSGTKRYRRRLKTPLERTNLVLPQHTLDQLEELESWLKHNETLMGEWGMRGKVRSGFRALFHGPGGTGKTLAASLLGKSTGRKVFRLEASPFVSKYIGETEKNLNKMFDKAERNQWILFFDEADALFGKRSGVSDSHDRYANLNTSHLLQRLESYTGLTILSSNLPENLQETILRRIRSTIAFPLPDPSARLRIWKQAFPEKARLGRNVDLKKLADSYEVDPAAIMRIVQYCCLRSLSQGTQTIQLEDIEMGASRELPIDEASTD